MGSSLLSESGQFNFLQYDMSLFSEFTCICYFPDSIPDWVKSSKGLDKFPCNINTVFIELKHTFKKSIFSLKMEEGKMVCRIKITTAINVYIQHKSPGTYRMALLNSIKLFI